jgi:pyrroloquinoline quinone (PQQ) biosynthesis protein C
MSTIEGPGAAFVRALRPEIKALQERHAANRLYSAILDGTLTAAQMKGWTLQSYYFKKYLFSLYPAVVPKAPDDVKLLFIKNLVTEYGVGADNSVSHLDLLKRFGRQIGLGDQDFAGIEPLLEVEAYCNFFDHIVYAGGFLDVAAGINFAVEGLFHTLYPRMARALERHYRIPRDQLFFFDDHETADVEHLEDGEYILARYAATPDQQRRAAHVARRALEFRQRAIEACFCAYAPRANAA